jgi:hypothetical protein
MPNKTPTIVIREPCRPRTRTGEAGDRSVVAAVAAVAAEAMEAVPGVIGCSR